MNNQMKITLLKGLIREIELMLYSPQSEGRLRYIVSQYFNEVFPLDGPTPLWEVLDIRRPDLHSHTDISNEIILDGWFEYRQQVVNKVREILVRVKSNNSQVYIVSGD